ncbi:hypothetical protein SCHPADRAFT_903208 [Schizopora paradoxa]|uniref:Conserved oligomeric Golgi complex subunit 7 n=1 Tax=Schizopora paradoxa TaxID=27342 RepID=A0A0H2SC79_9AGAM|nr:hypothetical protein SCHPADRAFT_903208 [Schizopora paradoxa]
MAISLPLEHSLLMPSSSEQLLRSMEESEDIVSWINSLIDDRDGKPPAISSDAGSNSSDLSEMERHLSHLTAMIEVACEDTSTQLERTIEDVSRTVPRLAYDLQFMQESSLSLNASLQQLEHVSSSSLGSTEVAGVLDRLHFLDTVQRNMTASLAVLREAEAWSSLESEVVAYISEQNYAKAAARLSEAASSLGVFQNTPEYESRKTLMVNLQNQLEAALSSALVSAINGSDVDACKKYFEIFCNIERESEFRSYWNGSKRKTIVDRWEGLAFKDCDEVPNAGKSSQTDMRFASFLSEFYNDILNVLQVERLSAMAIFPDPQPTLSTFISTTFSSSIHPSPSQRLSALVAHYGDFVLPELISSFKTTEEFAVSAEKIMEKASYSTPSPAMTSVPLEGERSDSLTLQRSHSRRKSHRQSISRRLVTRGSSGTSSNILLSGSTAFEMDRAWEESLFEPFLDYQCDFAALENKLLNERLKGIIKSSPTGSLAGARLLRERVVDVLSCAEDALTRCMAFTHGFGGVGLIQAIDGLFKSFLEISENDILNSRSSIPDTATIQTAGDEFSDLDYSPGDYAVIQLTLHLLEASRDILDRLGVLEAKLRSALAQFSGAFKLMRNDPSGLYITGTTKGAVNLLLGSSLNSMDLQKLLDTVDPETPQVQHGHPPQTPVTPYRRTSSGDLPIPSTPSPLLLGSRAAVSAFAKACQSRLQKTILAPLLKHLSEYASQSVWTSSDSQRRGGAGELSIPTFSRSPTQAIQRVAEGLLSLPRLFEVYADDDALSFEIESLPFINLRMLTDAADDGDGEAPDKLGSTSSAERADDGDIVSVKASRRKSLLPTLTPAPAPVPAKPSMLTPEVVTSAWLASLALSLLSHLTQTILPTIASLSSGGAAQLAEDLGYLSQIVKALNVQWEELELWRECVEMEEGDLEGRAGKSTNATDDNNGAGASELSIKIAERVLRIRSSGK